MERLGDPAPWGFVVPGPPLSFVTEPTVCVVDPSSSVTRRLCLFDVGWCSTKLLLLFDVVGASEVVIIEAAGEAEEVMETSVVALGEGETDNRLLEASESTGNPETIDWKKK